MLARLQSNRRGVLVDKLPEGIDAMQEVLLDPAGFTQHAVARHDAIKARPCPTIEIPISNIAARESWRDHAILSSAVKAAIPGLG